MWTALKTEFAKTRHLHFPLIGFLIIGMEFAWLCFDIRRYGPEELKTGYAGTLYNLMIIHVITMPILWTVVTSRLCDLEQRENMFKVMLTLEEAENLYHAKLICLFLYNFIATGIQTAGLLMIGKIRGFQDTALLAQVPYAVMAEFSVNLFLIVLIANLSLRMENPFVPVIAGIAGAFLGLMAMFFPMWLERLIPTSYYAVLSPVEMNWDEATRTISYSVRNFRWPEWLALMTAGALICRNGSRKISSREW